jgi:hypothetical protein
MSVPVPEKAAELMLFNSLVSVVITPVNLACPLACRSERPPNAMVEVAASTGSGMVPGSDTTGPFQRHSLLMLHSRQRDECEDKSYRFIHT